PSERLARISPTGASLNIAVRPLGPVSPGSPCASTSLGYVPSAWNAASCWSAAVSHSASLAASSGCSEVAGTVKNVPPQFAGPPGKTSAKSHPVLASPPPASICPLMTPSIHPGHTATAKEPSTNAFPPPQSHWVWLSDRPSAAAWARRSQRWRSFSFPSMLSSPSAVQWPSSTWLPIAEGYYTADGALNI